ncbi:hypothetical protein [Marinimicrobium sp. ARAG 43.8]|uniref:hypothetical protein n=1 Tax=Marinimicrobium sp. ARAG 43.8 TaxID=3418719 RepID=UPI003CEC8B24
MNVINAARVKPVAVLLLLWLLCYQAVAVAGAWPFASGNHSGPEAGSACHEAGSQALSTNRSVTNASHGAMHDSHEGHSDDAAAQAGDCCHLGCGCCVMGCHSLASPVLTRLLAPGSLPLLAKESPAVPEGPANTPYRPPILT